MLFMGQEFFALLAVPLLRGPQGRAAEARPEGAQRIPLPVPELPSRPGGRGLRRAHRRGGLPRLQAGLVRAHPERGGAGAAPGALAASQGGSRVRGAGPQPAGGGGAVSPCAWCCATSAASRRADRLLLLNLGTGLDLEPCPEPLLAPEPGKIWRLLLSSEHVRYGGMGAPALPEEGRLHASWTDSARADEHQGEDRVTSS